VPSACRRRQGASRSNERSRNEEVVFRSRGSLAVSRAQLHVHRKPRGFHRPATATKKSAPVDRKRPVVGQLFDLLPVAVYVCDSAGLIIHYNSHAAGLGGRSPRLNDPADRFCGSYRMYHLDGGPIAHPDCPMRLDWNPGALGCEPWMRNRSSAQQQVESNALLSSAKPRRRCDTSPSVSASVE
jgi:hypothetical protein